MKVAPPHARGGAVMVQAMTFSIVFQIAATRGRTTVRAAEQGLSLSDYILRELEATVAQPTLPELLDWLREQPKADIDFDAAAFIRARRGPLP